MFIIKKTLMRLIKNGKQTVILILLGVMGFVCVAVSYSYNRKIDAQENGFLDRYSDKKFYNVLDNFVGDKEMGISKESIGLLKEFNKKLNRSVDFDYYAIYEQPVYLEQADFKENVIYGYENGAKIDGEVISLYNQQLERELNYVYVKAMWLDKNFVRDYGLNLHKGSLFSEDNYKDNYGVILGDAYSGVYDVGDYVNIDYFFFSGRAVVKGFLEKGESIYYDGRLVNLDNYIIVPMPENCDMKNDWLTMGMLYMKNSGTIVSDIREKDIQRLLNSYQDDLGMEDAYYIKEYGDTEITNMTVNVKRVANVMRIIAVMCIVLYTVSFCIYRGRHTMQSKGYFSCLIVCGYSYGDIVKMIFIESLIAVGISYIVGNLVSVFLMNNLGLNGVKSILFINLIIAAVCIVVSLFCSVFLTLNKNICEYIKEGVVDE